MKIIAVGTLALTLLLSGCTSLAHIFGPKLAGVERTLKVGKIIKSAIFDAESLFGAGAKKYVTLGEVALKVADEVIHDIDSDPTLKHLIDRKEYGEKILDSLEKEFPPGTDITFDMLLQSIPKLVRELRAIF